MADETKLKLIGEYGQAVLDWEKCREEIKRLNELEKQLRQKVHESGQKYLRFTRPPVAPRKCSECGETFAPEKDFSICDQCVEGAVSRIVGKA